MQQLLYSILKKSVCEGVCDTTCLQVISENILLDCNSFIWLLIASGAVRDIAVEHFHFFICSILLLEFLY